MMVSKVKLLDVPELADIVDRDANASVGIDITKIYSNSSKVICWKCRNGHSFDEKVSVINRRKNKCFFCTGRSITSGENDLQTLYPALADEFDVTLNKITPDKISPKDTTTYFWICKYNHPSFPQQVIHRVERNTVCPYCSGRKVLSGENDLQSLYPEIAKEWDKEKNVGILPSEVSAYSYNSYYWICPKGHSYKKKVVSRTKFHKAIDCTKCTKSHSTSFPEQALYFYVKKCFPDAINRYKEPFEKGMELDIYIPFYRMGIEYDGAFYHKDTEQHDRELRKYTACKKQGIKLVRIKETKETWTDTADEFFYIEKKMKDKELSMFFWNMFTALFAFHMHTFHPKNSSEAFLNSNYGFPFEFNIAKDRPQILEYLTDKSNSFGEQYPELAAIWSKTGNGNLTPYMFTSGSNYQAVWECSKCHRPWKSPISSIVQRKITTCKDCSRMLMGKGITKGKTKINGCLAERNETLLKQWDYEENGDLSPYQIPLNYSFEVAWKCDECGYKWLSSPNSRIRNNKASGCPHCTGRVAMPGVDDLETLYPEIAKEWDFTKNGGILPSHIRPYSNKKYFWICPICSNSYQAYSGNRVKGSGCPECGRRKAATKKSKPIGQYDEKGVLINTYNSLREAANALGVTTNAISQAISKGGKSKGFYWKHY